MCNNLEIKTTGGSGLKEISAILTDQMSSTSSMSFIKRFTRSLIVMIVLFLVLQMCSYKNLSRWIC